MLILKYVNFSSTEDDRKWADELRSQKLRVQFRNGLLFTGEVEPCDQVHTGGFDSVREAYKDAGIEIMDEPELDLHTETRKRGRPKKE